MKVQPFICRSELPPKEMESLEAAKGLLGQFSFRDIVIMTSRINYLVGYEHLLPGKSRSGPPDLWLSQHFLNETTQESIRQEFGPDWHKSRVIFSRHQQAAVLKLAASVCGDTGATDFKSREGREAFGTSCLILNDHLATSDQLQALTSTSLTSVKKNLALQMAFFVEFYNPLPLRDALVRSEYLVGKMAFSAAAKANAPNLLGTLDALFNDATGLSLEEYRDLVMVVLYRYLSTDPAEVIQEPDRLVFHREGYLQGLRLLPEKFGKILALESRDLPTLRQDLQAASRLAVNLDFIALRKRPLVDLGNGYFLALDPALLVEKLGSGLKWSIANALPEELRNHGSELFGYVFQKYVNGLFERAYPRSSGLFHESPRDPRGGELFDGVLDYGEHTIVFEYKSGSVLAGGKYSGSWAPFEEAVAAHFGAGPEGALTQLARGIEKVFHRDRAQRARPRGWRPGKVTRVSPVLVVHEEFLAAPLMNWYLQSEFVRACAERSISAGIELRPVSVIDLRALEILLRCVKAGSLRFDQAINARLARDPHVEMPFHEAMNALFPQSYGSLGDQAADEVRDEVFKRTAAKLFGREIGELVVGDSATASDHGEGVA